LDDPEERTEFLRTFGTLTTSPGTGRALARRLGLRRTGATRVAKALACYAWNAETAYRARLRGEIQTAQAYEAIADTIYMRDLSALGWW